MLLLRWKDDLREFWSSYIQFQGFLGRLLELEEVPVDEGVILLLEMHKVDLHEVSDSFFSLSGNQGE